MKKLFKAIRNEDLESQLVHWFSQEIPAFGYIIPIELIQLEFGDDTLRSFMCSIPI